MLKLFKLLLLMGKKNSPTSKERDFKCFIISNLYKPVITLGFNCLSQLLSLSLSLSRDENCQGHLCLVTK
jgi:hypothetical protein